MRAGPTVPGSRVPVVGLAGLALLGGLLTGCTGGSAPAPPQPEAEATVPNQVPDDAVAVTDGPRPATTDVVLSTAFWNADIGAVEAAGYVSPVVENGGTCSLELEQDGRTVVVTAAAEADATTTICGNLTASGDELAAGAWTAVLRYRSATTEGTSEPSTVEVPR